MLTKDKEEDTDNSSNGKDIPLVTTPGNPNET